MEEIKNFITRLKEERTNLHNKARFMAEHKFNNELNVINNKIKIVNTIVHELDSVVLGNAKGIEVDFDWRD